MVREGSWRLDDPVAVRPEPEEVPEAEPIEVIPTLAFTWSRGALEVAIAAGLVLLAAILAAVAASISWGHVAEQGASVEMHLKEVQARFGLQGLSLDWTHPQFDDLDGIGQVRLAGTLFTVGLISMFVSGAILVVAVFVRGAHITGFGGVFGILSVALLATAAGLFPGGAEQAWDAAAQMTGMTSGLPRDIDWDTGPIVAWISVALSFAGIVTGFVATRHDDVS